MWGGSEGIPIPGRGARLDAQYQWPSLPRSVPEVHQRVQTPVLARRVSSLGRKTWGITSSFLFLPAQEVQLQFRPDLDKGRVVGEVTRDGSLLPGCHLGGDEQAAHVDDTYGNDDDSVDEDDCDYLCSIEEQATHPRKRGINPILRARPTIYYGTCFRGPSNGKQKSQKEHFWTLELVPIDFPFYMLWDKEYKICIRSEMIPGTRLFVPRSHWSSDV